MTYLPALCFALLALLRGCGAPSGLSTFRLVAPDAATDFHFSKDRLYFVGGDYSAAKKNLNW